MREASFNRTSNSTTSSAPDEQGTKCRCRCGCKALSYAAEDDLCWHCSQGMCGEEDGEVYTCIYCKVRTEHIVHFDLMGTGKKAIMCRSCAAGEEDFDDPESGVSEAASERFQASCDAYGLHRHED